MGIWQRIKRGVRSIFASGVTTPAQWLVDWFHQNDSDSGLDINGKSATAYPPVWYAVNKIGGHIGQLPLCVFEQDPNDHRKKAKASRHPGYRMMKRPNSAMTGIIFRETLQYHALLWGNGRAHITRNNRQDPMEAVILPPDRTVTVLVNGTKWHAVTIRETGEIRKLYDGDVIHIPGLGYDGLSGYSLIELAKNSIGLGLAAEKFGNRLFKSDAIPGIVLEAPPGVFRDEVEAKAFIDNWNNYHSGLDNVGKTALLREGVQAKPLSMRGRDAQWVEQRKFQRQDTALLFLLEQILGDDASVSYNSLEQKNSAYLVNCLMRWIKKWEEELNEKLLSIRQKESESHYFKFNVNGLLRGTIKERAEFYQVMRQIQVLSANEVRELEDMNPRDDDAGDEYDNPAITPGWQDSTTEATEDVAPNEVSDLASARLKHLVSSRLRELLSVEGHRVTAAASKESDFLVWMDGFYSPSNFGGRIASVYEDLGAASAAAIHIDDSMSALRDIYNSGGTVEAFNAATVKWHERAINLSVLVLNGVVV